MRSHGSSTDGPATRLRGGHQQSFFVSCCDDRFKPPRAIDRLHKPLLSHWSSITQGYGLYRSHCKALGTVLLQGDCSTGSRASERNPMLYKALQ
jgi:hypothetical protein